MSNEKNLSLIASRLLELRDHVDSSYLFPTPEPSARTLFKQIRSHSVPRFASIEEQRQILFGRFLIGSSKG